MNERLAMPTVRPWGVLLAVLLLAEGAIGVDSAGQPFSGLDPLLLAHMALGAIVIGLTSWAFVRALESPSRSARVAAWITLAAVWATGATGAIFLLTQFPGGAPIDRGLALASVAGATGMAVTGRGRARSHLRGPDRERIE